MKRGAAAAASRSARRASDFVALTKPRLNLLVVAIDAAGYVMAGGETLGRRTRRLHCSLGTALVAGGAAAFNQVIERDTDALMRRTRLRPLPDGRLQPAKALIFAARSRRRRPAAARVGGRTCSPRSWRSRRSSATCVVYTPLKRRTSFSHGRRRDSRARCRRSSAGRRRAAQLPREAWRSSGSCSCGRCRTSWRSRGCTATTTRAPASRCCRSSSRTAGAPAGRRSSTAAALVPVSLVPTLIGMTGRRLLRRRAGARRSLFLCADAAFARTRTVARRAPRCSSARSSTCRCSGS